MTAAQTLMIKLSSARQRLNELLQVETRSAEEQTEMETLTAEVSKREPELRAALAAEPDPKEVLVDGDPEARELAQLTAKSNMGAIVLAVTEKRHCLGAELELQQAHGLAENQIPLDMLRVEQRAAGVTTAPTNVGISQAEIVTTCLRERRGSVLGDYSPDHTRRRFGLPGFVHSPGCWRTAQRLIGRTGNRFHVRF